MKREKIETSIRVVIRHKMQYPQFDILADLMVLYIEFGNHPSLCYNFFYPKND
jgi:hypothetical protein